MRFFKIVASLLVHVVLLLICINALYALAHVDTAVALPAEQTSLASVLFSSLPHFIQPATVLSQVVWWSLAVVLIVVSWTTGIASIGSRTKVLRVKTPDGGSLLLEPGAIINFTKSQVDSHPAVTRHRVHVRQVGGKSVAITAKVSVIPTHSLPQIKQELEQSIRTGFSQVLGIEKIDDIMIVLNLDEKHLGTRPGPAGRAEPPVPVPPRAAIEPAGELDEPREFGYTPEELEK